MTEEERTEAAQSTAEILARSDDMAERFERILRESEQLLDTLRSEHKA